MNRFPFPPKNDTIRRVNMPSQNWFGSSLNFLMIFCCGYDDRPCFPSRAPPGAPPSQEGTHWQLQRKANDAPPRIGMPEPELVQMDWVISDERLREWILQDETIIGQQVDGYVSERT
jgi:hypothetical protein